MTDHPESGENYPPNNFEVRQRDIPTIRVRNQMFFNQQPYINKPLANNNILPTVRTVLVELVQRITMPS